MLQGAIHNTAGQYIYPVAHLTVWCPNPKKIKAIEPVMAMGRVSAAEVPDACFILALKCTNNGTDRVPPPMPSNPDLIPIKQDANLRNFDLILISFLVWNLSFWCDLGEEKKNILILITSRNMANIKTNQLLCNEWARIAPSIVPTMAHGAMRIKIGQIILPRR